MQNDKNSNGENGNISVEVEELNYKKGYALLFNGISDHVKLLMQMVKQLLILQRKSEELCIAEPMKDNEITQEHIMEMMANIIKQNMQSESENDDDN